MPHESNDIYRKFHLKSLEEVYERDNSIWFYKSASTLEVWKAFVFPTA